MQIARSLTTPTLPPVFLGLYTHWFNRWALLIGWATGMIGGTLMAFSAIISGIPGAPLLQTYTFTIGGVAIPVYAAFAALILNLVLSIVLTPIFDAIGLKSGKDVITPADYEYAPAEPKEPVREALG